MFERQIKPEAIGQPVSDGDLAGDTVLDDTMCEVQCLGVRDGENDLGVGITKHIARDLVEENDQA